MASKNVGLLLCANLIVIHLFAHTISDKAMVPLVMAGVFAAIGIQKSCIDNRLYDERTVVHAHPTFYHATQRRVVGICKIAGGLYVLKNNSEDISHVLLGAAAVADGVADCYRGSRITVQMVQTIVGESLLNKGSDQADLREFQPTSWFATSLYRPMKNSAGAAFIAASLGFYFSNGCAERKLLAGVLAAYGIGLLVKNAFF